jgi:hypothetical protein
MNMGEFSEIFFFFLEDNFVQLQIKSNQIKKFLLIHITV